MRRAVLLGLMGAFLALVFVGALVFFSRAGFELALRVTDTLAGEAVTIESGSGRLADQWRVAGVHVSFGGHRLSIGELSCRWQPARLLGGTVMIERLAVRELAITVAEEDTVPSRPEAGGGGGLPALLVPVAVEVNDFAVEGLTVKRGEGLLYSLNRLQTRLSFSGDHLSLSSLHLQSPGLALSAAGELQTTPGWPLNLQASWSFSVPGCERLQGETALAGTMDEVHLTNHLTAPVALEVHGVARHLLDTPIWEVQASGQALDPSRLCTDWPGVATDVSFAATGSLDEYRGSLAASLHLPDIPAFTADLRFTGLATELSISPSPIRCGEDGGEVSGRLSWTDGLQWETVLHVDSWSPGLFVPTLGGTVDGELKSSGSYGSDGLRWRGEISGLRYVDGELAGPLTGAGQVHGSDDGLALDFSLSPGRGRIQVSGTAQWQDRLAWEGRLLIEGIDPSFLPDLPAGAISGSLFAAGTGAGSDLDLEVRLEDLHGDLAGYELQGGGRVEVHEGRIAIDALQIENGNNRLSLNGTIDDQLEVSFHVQGAELDRLSSALSGSVDISGQLSGTREEPKAEAALVASGLGYDSYMLDRVSGTVRFGLEGPGIIGLNVQFDGLNGSPVRIERARLEIAGPLTDHRLAVAIDSDLGRANLSATGSLDDAQHWNGIIGDFSLQSPSLGSLTVQGRSTVEVGADRLAVETLCIAGGSTSLCAAGSWVRSGTWAIELTDLQLDLADVSRWGVMTTALAGQVSGWLSVAGTGAVLHDLAGTFSAAELFVPVPEKSWLPELRWSEIDVSFELVDAALRARLRSGFSDRSTLRADLEISDVADLSQVAASMPISGTVQVEGLDPHPLALLTDDYLMPTGHLSTQLTIGGSIGRPLFSGSLALNGGRLGFPELGIALDDLHGTVLGVENRLDVDLQARSGAGTVRGNGSMSFAGDDWSGTFTINGSDCELLNLSELQIIASPAVHLKIGPDGGDLSGVVRVPRAFIQPEEMQGSIAASGDVIFVDQNEPSTSWPFLLDLQVILGEQVTVKGYGLDAGLKGALTVSGRPEQGLVGRGELGIVRGTFALYGTPLEISRGRLIFSGGAIDNPELDIVAQKNVQATGFNGDGAVVGVTVSGSAREYYLELFSVPPLSDNDIVAYLLLDKPIASGDDQSRGLVNEAMSAIGLAAGNELLGGITGMLPIDDLHLEGSTDRRGASLVVAKRLTDELSISYDFNLFEHAGAFRVRYEFGHGFSVQSRSAVDSNGLELLYTFER